MGLAEGADPLAAVDFFESAPWAAWAQPNYVVREGAMDLIPNDPQFGAAGQYFHTNTQTHLAWDITTGNPSILVGIADDGVGINHPDLAANIWTNPGETPGNGIDDDSNGFIDDVRGWDFNSNDNNTLPVGRRHARHARRGNHRGTDEQRSRCGRHRRRQRCGGHTDGRRSLVPIRWASAIDWTSAMVADTYHYAADNNVRIVNASPTTSTSG